MTDRPEFPSQPDGIAGYKQQAKRLRAIMAGQGTPITHSAALEIIARQHGARDWNTLSAVTPRAAPEPAPATLRFAVGTTVSGRYLNQPFTGRILALSALQSGGLYRITIHFDEPVDVVTFESFQALRRRINAVIDAGGVSPRRTSNGLPHLVIDGEGGQ